MDDQLKELIASNKNLIDTAAPNQAVFPLILEKMGNRKRKKGPSEWRYFIQHLLLQPF